MYRTIIWASLLLILIGQTTIGQNKTLKSPSAGAEEMIVTIEGCLSKNNESGKLILTEINEEWDEDGDQYYLIGYITELSKYIGGRLKITGRVDSPPTPPLGNDPIPLKVKTWSVINDPKKETPLRIEKVADWKTYENGMYGIIVRAPMNFSLWSGSIQEDSIEQNFTESDKTIRLFSMEIPRQIYGESTGFSSGSYSIHVIPKIRNAEKCNCFKTEDGTETEISFRTINGLFFTQADQFSAGLSNYYLFHSLHTYQNGLCYAFHFEFHSISIGAIDLPPCDFHTYDTSKLMDLLLSNVNFTKPTLDTRFKASLEDQTDCTNFKKYFTGAIGEGILVKLELTLKNGILSGTERYVRIGKPLWLKGTVDAEGNFTLEEHYPEDTVTGIFKGKFYEACQVMIGDFSKPDGSRLQPFKFRETGPGN
jgi:hypothetical protein